MYLHGGGGIFASDINSIIITTYIMKLQVTEGPRLLARSHISLYEHRNQTCKQLWPVSCSLDRRAHVVTFLEEQQNADRLIFTWLPNKRPEGVYACFQGDRLLLDIAEYRVHSTHNVLSLTETL